ncbi:hypothetical protein WICPIJ_000836 [Wickerhamomyces pijperi]|uniref:Uncharacterized protein n=1 Tax=Wickerhamomyces pijperi TaxID=599730 RepID=A0A9P8QFS8_WICPI|nr:hypothetical protein WICPIJ_000836 [Wickerhamomyces pijperi]
MSGVSVCASSLINGENFLNLKLDFLFLDSTTMLLVSMIFSRNFTFFSNMTVYSSFSGAFTEYFRGCTHSTPALIHVVQLVAFLEPCAGESLEILWGFPKPLITEEDDKDAVTAVGVLEGVDRGVEDDDSLMFKLQLYVIIVETSEFDQTLFRL